MNYNMLLQTSSQWGSIIQFSQQQLNGSTPHLYQNTAIVFQNHLIALQLQRMCSALLYLLYRDGKHLTQKGPIVCK